MARSVDFPEADGTASSVSGSAGDLRTKQYPNSSVSCWELDDEELQLINQTRRIWVRTDTFDELKKAPDGGRWQPTMRVTARKEHAINDQWREDKKDAE